MNRIGSSCWYKDTDNTWTGGKLLSWSTDHVEGENGFGPYPVGVIEDEKTGCCKSIYVENICFASIPPT